MILSEEEFKAWKADYATRAIVELLDKKRDELRRGWEHGEFTDYEKDGTIFTNVGNMGTCKGYAYIMDLDYEQYLVDMEVEGGKQERAGTTRSGGAD